MVKAEEKAAKAAKKAEEKAAKAAAAGKVSGVGLDPKVQGQTPEVETPKGADLSFAVNVVKLNRAKAYVQKMAPAAKGAEFAKLVKERYVELGGLLIEDKPTAGPRNGKMVRGQVVNVAEDDGSKD